MEWSLIPLTSLSSIFHVPVHRKCTCVCVYVCLCVLRGGKRNWNICWKMVVNLWSSYHVNCSSSICLWQCSGFPLVIFFYSKLLSFRCSKGDLPLFSSSGGWPCWDIPSQSTLRFYSLYILTPQEAIHLPFPWYWGFSSSVKKGPKRV